MVSYNDYHEKIDTMSYSYGIMKFGNKIFKKQKKHLQNQAAPQNWSKKPYNTISPLSSTIQTKGAFSLLFPFLNGWGWDPPRLYSRTLTEVAQYLIWPLSLTTVLNYAIITDHQSPQLLYIFRSLILIPLFSILFRFSFLLPCRRIPHVHIHVMLCCQQEALNSEMLSGCS